MKAEILIVQPKGDDNEIVIEVTDQVFEILKIIEEKLWDKAKDCYYLPWIEIKDILNEVENKYNEVER